MSDQQQQAAPPNAKKRVSIAAPPSSSSHDADDVNGDVDRRRAPPPRRKYSMGPKQQSLPPFAPDNYSSDEDDAFLHEENANAKIAASSSTSTSMDVPGAGWTNGDVPPQFTPAMTLHPYTRPGRLALYNHHRRMINFSSSWSRIGGEGSTEMDAVHSVSSAGSTIMSGCPEEEGRTVRALVAQLCERFYDAGWATGTGGGVSIRVGGGWGGGGGGRPYRVFVAPSGVMKEDMVGDDVFELDMDMGVIRPPRTPNLRLSACTPLWYAVYRNRPSAMCVIHTHSMHAQLATLLDRTETSPSLRLTHLEMLKGVGNHSYDDVLEVPIIDNRPTEDLLADQMEEALSNYPKCNAVLVRRHGLYVWGDSWEQAKAQCESFDYLFESAVKMRSMGMECGMAPRSGTYHVEKEGKEGKVGKEEEEKKEEDSSSPPPAKRSKSSSSTGDDAAAAAAVAAAPSPPPAPAFNASDALDNAADMACHGATTTIPLAPRDSKLLLLDIEGTTTSISFVKDVLFPYVLNNLDDYVGEMMMAAEDDDYARASSSDLLDALRGDVDALDDAHPAKVELSSGPAAADGAEVIKLIVKTLMKHDVKATGLKSLQGKMWKAGYASGELVGHLYSDFVPMMNWCNDNGVKVCIYSSGSIAAQKLLFGHTSAGDVTSRISGYFDTTSGSKREADSYYAIAGALGVETKDVIFVSDLEAEIYAADRAGMKAVVAARPGNAPLGPDTRGKFPVVRSLLQLCGAD